MCRRAGAMICKNENEVNGVKEILKEEKQLFHLWAKKKASNWIGIMIEALRTFYFLSSLC